jgi:hypothetical protein
LRLHLVKHRSILEAQIEVAAEIRDIARFASPSPATATAAAR